MGMLLADNEDLSLNCTATQNPWRLGLALGNTPNARIFVGDTNMLVSFALGDAHVSRHLTQNPQCESVEYRLRWVPNAKLLRWPCTFHVFCVDFICIG